MTAGILISQIVTGVFAAYGFSKGKFKGQNLCFMIVLGALMIPIHRVVVNSVDLHIGVRILVITPTLPSPSTLAASI